MADKKDAVDKPVKRSVKPKELKPADSPAAAVEPETVLSVQENNHMDIHANHLHRAPGRKIRHYFFEFLMLFLAVFCGFLAENWREQLREHRREKEYIRSMLEDLKSDTLQSKRTLIQLKRLSTGIDSVLIALSDPGIAENSNKAYRLWSQSLGLEVFVSNDRTIQQLKNNGELRLIRNKAVSDRIMNYGQILNKYYTQSNLMYGSLHDLISFSQLFDFISLDKSRNSPVPLTPQGRKFLNQAYVNRQLWNKGLAGLIGWLEEVNREATKLLSFIQKEYHLE
jgi:hypothetical protein